MFTREKELELYWRQDKHDGNHIQLASPLTSISITKIAESLMIVYFSFHISKTLKDIVKNSFYFSNRVEIERIIEHTLDMINDEKDEKGIHLRQETIHLLKDVLELNKPLSMETMIRFQLKKVHPLFINIVGLAIDEFMREQAHQEFIHNVRIFMKRKPCKFEEIHVVQGETFLFFQANGKRLSMQELESLIQKEPLYMLGIPHTDKNLAPFVALSPEKIYMYGDDPFEAKTQSIINIFQEKVTFQRMVHFPFSRYDEKT